MISSTFFLNKMGTYFVESSKIVIPDYFPTQIQILENQDVLYNNTSYFCEASNLGIIENAEIEQGCILFICSFNNEIDLKIPTNCVGILLSCSIATAFNVMSKYAEEDKKLVATLNSIITRGENAYQFIEKISQLTSSDTILLDKNNTIIFSSPLYQEGLLHSLLKNTGQLDDDTINKLILNPGRYRGNVGATLYKEYGTVIFATRAVSKEGLTATLLLEIKHNKSLDMFSIMSHCHDILEDWLFSSGSFESVARINTSFQKIWDKLKVGDYLNDAEMISVFKNLPHPICGNVCVAVVCFDNYDNIPYNYLLAKLRNMDEDINIAVENRDIIMVLPTKLVNPGERNTIFENRADLNELLTEFNAFMMYGNYTSRPRHVKEIFDLSKKTLLIARKVQHNHDERILFYEDYASYSIVDIAIQTYKNKDAYLLINPILLRLTEYDVQNNDNLADVLFFYLVNERNVKKTAERMHMHRNTLMNKLNKINSLVTLDLEDSRLRQRLIFSGQFIKYYKNVLNIPIPQKIE